MPKKEAHFEQHFSVLGQRLARACMNYMNDTDDFNRQAQGQFPLVSALAVHFVHVVHVVQVVDR